MIQNDLAIYELTDEGDLAIIHQLAIQIWEPTYRNIISKQQIDFMFEKMYSMPSLQHQFNELGHHFLVASKQNKPVGFATYFFESAQKVRIPKLYILSDYQKTGIGTGLLNKIESIGMEQAIKHIELNVNRFNKALKFYEKAGFKIIETVDIPYHNFVLNDYVLMKTI